MLEPTHDISKAQVIRLAKDKLKILVRKFKKEFEEKENDTLDDLESQIIDYLFNSEQKVNLKELSQNLYIKGVYSQEMLVTTMSRLVKSNKVNVTHTRLWAVCITSIIAITGSMMVITNPTSNVNVIITVQPAS
ncbi:hypothetical protein OGZ01_20835 [Vibrio harveyi]|nr:hypothetical protein [Vibrio harveyi]